MRTVYNYLSIFCLLLLANHLSVVIVEAQSYVNVYRPSVDRLELITPKFRIIFPAGADSAAFAAAFHLENEYNAIQHLVGGDLKHFPVILNNHNELSNGFVTTLFFRSEIEIPPPKSYSMNPTTGNWLYTVVPHELVHALHFSNIPSGGLARFFSIFSPDLGKSVHGAAPLGVHEGLAVYYESKLNNGIGGRGNYGWFTNHTNTVMTSSDPWSLAQTLMPSIYTNPGDRHYKGGYDFTNWILDNYGDQTLKNSIEYFAKYPFLGFGRALRHATKKSVSVLYKNYIHQFDTNSAFNIEKVNPETITIQTSIKGGNIYHPKWISNNEVIYYRSSSYNSSAGFYTYNLDSNKETLLLETQSVGNGVFHLSNSKSHLFYSRYIVHPFQTNSFTMQGYEYDILNDYSSINICYSRLFNPFQLNNIAYGLKTENDTNQLFSVKDGRAEVFLSVYPHTIVQAEPSPPRLNEIALLLNVEGNQGLWFVDTESPSVDITSPDILINNGSILSINWSTEQYLLLSVDHYNRVSNYFFDIKNKKLFEIISSSKNTFFADINFDTGKMIYITQETEEQLLTLVDWDPELMNEVDFATQIALESKEIPHIRSDWQIQSYRTGLSWLVPRTVIPTATERNGFVNHGYGVSMSGGDLLQRQSYQLNLQINNVLETELYYRNTSFYPGYQFQFFYRPLNTTAGLAIERGARLSIPFMWRTAWNTRSSWITFNPGIRYRQFKFPDTITTGTDNQVTRDIWFNDPSVTASLAYYHRIRQHRRDIQPNSGTVFFANGELYTGTDRSGEEPAGLRFGVIQYLPILSTYNHGLMVRADILTQRKSRVYSTTGLVYNGFEENPLFGLHNAGSINVRYTFPITYVDDGFISVPFFMDRIYMSLNLNNVFDLNTTTSSNWTDNSRTVYGTEIRSDFRLFNLSVNAGAGIGWEPTRDDYTLFFSIVF